MNRSKTKRTVAFVAAIVLGGCEPKVVPEQNGGVESTGAGTSSTSLSGADTLADETEDGTTLVDGTGSGTSLETSSESTSSSTTEDTIECEPQPWFQCSGPINCSGPDSPCGKVSSFFDENGCPRPKCGDDDDPFWCPEGMRCHRPYEECGWCMEHDLMCADDRYQDETYCGCSGSGTCNVGRICVPADLFPEGYCDP